MIRERLQKIEQELQEGLTEAADNYGFDPAGGPLIGPLSLLLTLVKLTIEVEQTPWKVKDAPILCDAYEDYMLSIQPKRPPDPPKPPQPSRYAKTLTNEEKRQVIALYDGGRGISQAEICAHLNTTRWIVRQTLLDAQAYMPQKKTRLTAEQDRQICEMYTATKMSPAQIGVYVGISHATVEAVLRQAGLRKKGTPRRSHAKMS